MAEEEDRWQRLIDGLRKGDPQVASEVCRQYEAPLRKLADRHMTPGLQRRIDPEDVVQSVCRTFLRRASVGQFRLADSEGLWQLLCAITLTKVREQARFHLRQKRGLDQEIPAGALSSGDTAEPFGAAPGPSPDEAAAFADQYQQVLASLDEEDRQVVELKLQDHTNEEVAERLGISERTVRRIVKRAQARFLRAFEGP
jgi:RNA polymerase sigma-70 factor (ECF subfamily)